jgi:predicted nucleic acid-binding protein
VKRVHLDANVILRFLRNDDRKQSPQAAALFQREQGSDEIELIVSAVTLMEVFYVLTRAYDLPRAEAAAVLTDLLLTGSVTCPQGEIVLDALSRITGQKVSFGDAHLAACAVADGGEVASFDRGVGGLAGVVVYPL